MVRALINTKSIFKLSLLAFFLILLWTGRTYSEKSRLFPELVGRTAIILILVSLIQSIMKPKREKKKDIEVEPEPPSSDIREEKLRRIKEMEESGQDAGYELLEEKLRKKRFVQSALIILISLGIGYLGGFLITVPFYFITFGILHGPKKQKFKYVIIALGITLVTYLLFTTLMGVPLFKGLLWEL